MKPGNSLAASRSTSKSTTVEHGLRVRVGALLNERELLLEEVRQLRAAVHIYSEIVQRLSINQSYPR